MQTEQGTRQMRENLPCCNGGQLKWEKPIDASVPGMGGAAQWLDTRVHPSKSLLDLHAAHSLQTISHSLYAVGFGNRRV